MLPATTGYERNDLTMVARRPLWCFDETSGSTTNLEAKEAATIFSLSLLNVPVWKNNTLESKTEMEWLEEFYNAALVLHVQIISNATF